ncbi:MAG: CHRD domain-containing protein [Deltaproteobacteria bacterium]|nr:CHRD domain-containing protein [Deltaproteobacteria bacterium]
MRSVFRRVVSWRFLAVGALLLGIAGMPGSAMAQRATDFTSNLNAGQEVPAGSSNGMGVAYLNIDGQDRLCVALTVQDLEGQIVAAHIHGPAAPGVNGPVIFDLKPNGSPINICVGPPTADQLRELRRGLWYLNVHTSEAAAGEIRGQIMPVRK